MHRQKNQTLITTIYKFKIAHNTNHKKQSENKTYLNNDSKYDFRFLREGDGEDEVWRDGE
jgi:hypothetical protein